MSEGSSAENGGDSLKRGREDEHETAEILKKTRDNEGTGVSVHNSSLATAVTVSSKEGEEIIEVPANKVGNIIGSKGAVIQDMQARTGAKIYVNQDFPAGSPRQVVISGNPHQVKHASDLVKKVVEFGPTAIHANMLSGGPMSTTTMECPQHLVGRVIGSSGSTIKDILARSGAKIQINQEFPDGVPREITISGTSAAVTTATQLIAHVMENGPMSLPQAGGFPPPQQQMSAYNVPSPYGAYGPTGGLAAPLGGGMYGMPQQYGMPSQQPSPYAPPAASFSGGGGSSSSSQHKVINIERGIVGRIIGKGGETITQIQSKSGCKVQIEQQVPEGQPCKINMSGTPQSIAIAEQLINDLMSTPGQMRGGGGSSSYGGVSSMPYGMPQSMHAPQSYSSTPSIMPSYGLPQPQIQQTPYGTPQFQYPQQSQGGYGGAAAGMTSSHTGIGGYAGASLAQTAPPVQSLWTEYKTEDGTSYWFNSTTGISQWDKPNA